MTSSLTGSFGVSALDLSALDLNGDLTGASNSAATAAGNGADRVGTDVASSVASSECLGTELSTQDLLTGDRLNEDLATTVEAMAPALAPERWPFGLEWLPKSACLVGGSVRDALLGRRSEYLDLDFVLPQQSVETAQAIARHYQAGFVLLDAERQIARVVFKDATADFALQVGPSLQADLERRDFTVNAIAYNPHTEHLFDPLGGYQDLQRRRLRMVSADNLQEDPLRLLRAYRQAAQLGFEIQPATRATIRDLAPQLRTIAAERVQVELQYLLAAANGTPWLQSAWEDGLLRDWLPSATATSLTLVAGLDQAMELSQVHLPELVGLLHHRIRTSSKTSHLGSPGQTPDNTPGSQRSWRTLAKLVCLVSPRPEIAETQLRQLKYSRAEVQAVIAILGQLPGLRAAIAPDPQEPLNFTLRQQCQFFQAAQATFPAIALLLLAEAKPWQAIAPLVQRFLDPQDAVAHPLPLLSGQDLMSALHIPPGPHIGQILAELQLAQAEGLISTAPGAIAYTKAWLNRPDPRHSR